MSSSARCLRTTAKKPGKSFDNHFHFADGLNLLLGGCCGCWVWSSCMGTHTGNPTSPPPPDPPHTCSPPALGRWTLPCPVSLQVGCLHWWGGGRPGHLGGEQESSPGATLPAQALHHQTWFSSASSPEQCLVCWMALHVLAAKVGGPPKVGGRQIHSWVCCWPRGKIRSGWISMGRSSYQVCQYKHTFGIRKKAQRSWKFISLLGQS